MEIARSARTGQPARQPIVRTSLLVVMILIAAVPLPAQQYRPAPPFEGKVIPEPPSQGRPWTPPETKLPKFLVTATGILFDQGVADPRDCEYRHVEVANGSITKTRAFALPGRQDIPGRFVVCWDGLVYPAVTIGDPADLDRDIKNLAAHLKETRESPDFHRFPQVLWSLPSERQGSYGAGVDDRSPIKLCMLLRLGRAELAETLFAAGTTWTPEPRARDLTDYHMSYMTLATDWAGSAFGRLITAHSRGEDVIALDTARKLAKFRDLAAAKADAMGFPRDRSNRAGPGPAPRFYFLTQLDELLRDHERRAKLAPRPPIPKSGGDPSARIAALIRDLDEIDERQMSSPGSAQPGSSPLVKELIAEGDAAVEPLLEVLESDERLTRSVSSGRGGLFQGWVHPVREAAFAALTGILKTHEFDDARSLLGNAGNPAARKILAAKMREFWQKTRTVPLVERWYKTLLDDSAGQARWLEAAGAMVQPDRPEGMPLPKPGTRPMKGEPLRAGRNPRVSDLMLRRAQDIERMGNPQSSYDQGFNGACQMGSIVAEWDEKASLPLLKQLSNECRARSDRWRTVDARQNASFDRGLASSLAKFIQIRVGAGDVNALDEYASWLRTTTPKMLEYVVLDAFKPLLAHPDHPALAEASQWLFNDPKSPWVPLVPEARGERMDFFHSLFPSPLIAVRGFREGVITALGDKTPLGTLKRDDEGAVHRRIKDLPTGGFSIPKPDLDGVEVGVEYPFRTCDQVAWELSSLEGSPRFSLFWPEAQRDLGVAACVAYLKRFGERFVTEAKRRARLPERQGPPEVSDTPEACNARRRCRGPRNLHACRRGGNAAGAHGLSAAGPMAHAEGFSDRAERHPQRCDAPRIRHRWCRLASGGGSPGRPLGTFLRLCRPPRDRPRSGLRDRVRHTVPMGLGPPRGRSRRAGGMGRAAPRGL
jgi:hypothetical protein